MSRAKNKTRMSFSASCGLMQLVGAGVVCLSVGFGGIAAHADQHEKKTEETVEAVAEGGAFTIEESFDSEVSSDAIVVDTLSKDEKRARRKAKREERRGKKAAKKAERKERKAAKREARREYRMSRKREGGKLDVAIEDQGQGGDKVTFAYNQDEKNVMVAVADAKLDISFGGGDGMVHIGKKKCADRDYKCISKRVRKAFKKLDAEDVAALEAAMREQLADMNDGHEIRYVLNVLSHELSGGNASQ